MERGSTIGMDRFGLDHLLPTAKRVEVVAQLCAEGYARQMVLSHDANCWTDMQSEEDKRRLRPHWHYNHISDDIVPALRAAGSRRSTSSTCSSTTHAPFLRRVMAGRREAHVPTRRRTIHDVRGSVVTA